MKKGPWIALAVALGAGAAWLASRPAPEAAEKHAWSVRRAFLEPGAFALHYESTLDSQLLANGKPAHIAVTVDGTLDVAARAGGERTRVLRLRDAKVVASHDAKALGGYGEGLAAALEQPSVATYEACGALVDARFAADSFTARALAFSFAAAAQYVPSGAPTSSGWQADERDANGEYRAKYAATSNEAARKTWLVGPRDGSLSIGQARGTATVDFRLDGAVVTGVEYLQAGEAAMPSAADGKRASYSTTIRLTRIGPADGALASTVDGLQLQALSDAMAADRNVPPAPTRSLDAILADAHNLDDDVKLPARSALRLELTGALAADPAAVTRVEKLLREQTSTEDAENALVEGIVGARTPAAQHAVAGMLGDLKLGADLRVHLLQGEVLNTNPNDEMVQTLSRLAFHGKDLSYAADVSVALGAAALQLHEAQAATSREIARQLVEHAGGLVTPRPDVAAGIRIRWLSALGNTGDPQARDVIVAGLSDPDELVRAQAAGSLRFQDPATLQDVMARQMAKDDSIHVRRALIDAARWMGPGPMLPFVEKALFSDRSEFVRIGAAYTLASWAQTAPALRDVLAEALAKEKSRTVRESLRNFVHPNTLAPPQTMRPIGGQP